MLEALLSETEFSPVVKAETDDFVWIDLSQNNPGLAKVDTNNSEEFSEFVNQYLRDNNTTIAVGGYNEPRNIYKRSEEFNSSELEERFIHLGLDLWTTAGTPVFAPLKGKIHSFKNNLGEGNYGPTIILEHNLKGNTFYTLYGHLTTKSLAGLEAGKTISSGEDFAAIGNYPDNGDYPPHLHFQVIQDMKGMEGDFPGVTSLSNQKADLKNCLDPNLILKIKA
ncbi:MAG: peptidoglycan DD-metalloendopeptidase family protein [Vicingaceae bacterium]|nr:peptidoglycan DD-metalloendopeptidase family protein [Vicingaceae bacterium]